MAREVLELTDYDFKIHHLRGKANRRVDALSHRPDYDQGDKDNQNVVVLPDHIWARTGKATPNLEEEVLQQWVDPHQLKHIDGWWEKAGREVVTAGEEEQRDLICRHHDSPIHGHPGIQKTTELVE